MALLDVSSVLSDPDFTEFVTVKRREQVKDSKGRAAVSETLFHQVVAVVCAGSPDNLNREEDYGTFMRSLSLVLKFRIRGASEETIDGITKTYLPDVVVWRGNNFVVDSFDPYPQFGNGFYQVTCQSMDRNDNALDIALTGQAAFTNKTNSGNIAYVI